MSYISTLYVKFDPALESGPLPRNYEINNFLSGLPALYDYALNLSYRFANVEKKVF